MDNEKQCGNCKYETTLWWNPPCEKCKRNPTLHNNYEPKPKPPEDTGETTPNGNTVRERLLNGVNMELATTGLLPASVVIRALVSFVHREKARALREAGNKSDYLTDCRVRCMRREDLMNMADAEDRLAEGKP